MLWKEVKCMSTFETVKRIVVDQLQVAADDVKIDSTFIDDLGADSLDIVELIMAFEEEFNIEIPDEIAEKIKTVKDAVDYIEKEKQA
jgi:acyl carrier protein